jgi:TonB-dependent starch-binding outer membrane protein SusC
MRTRFDVRSAAQRMTALCALPVLACATATTPAAEAAPRAYAALDSIVLAYGKTTPASSTVAVGSVSARDIATMRVTRLEELLQGRVAGAQVFRTATGDYTIRIRNATSLLPSGSAEPLFVLDGMPMLSGRPLGSILDGISPYDIARIDVLKDAGATAAYGARGANGVVLITTKRSRNGRIP